MFQLGKCTHCWFLQHGDSLCTLSNCVNSHLRIQLSHHSSVGSSRTPLGRWCGPVGAHADAVSEVPAACLQQSFISCYLCVGSYPGSSNSGESWDLPRKAGSGSSTSSIPPTSKPRASSTQLYSYLCQNDVCTSQSQLGPLVWFLSRKNPLK